MALGDSHTYGTSVRGSQAWPALLAGETGKTVYSMAHGGYGPVHAVENLDIALGLKPEVVIFGLYFGNDFYDDFLFAYKNRELAHYVPADSITALRAAEEEASIEKEVGFLFGVGTDLDGAAAAERDETGVGRIADWLSNNLRIVGLFKTARNLITMIRTDSPLLAPDLEKVEQALSDTQRRYVSVYRGKDWKTVLTSRYRLRVMDTADDRIAAGVNIAVQAITEMHERVTASGSRFLVVFLPTKEFVFLPRVTNPSAHPGLTALGRAEDRLHREMLAVLTERGIPVIDVTQALRHSSEQPYFENGDGHPNPLGHRIIAGEIAARLTANGG